MEFTNPESIKSLHEKLTAAERITIVTHMRPDGDAIGSSMGMYHTLSLYGKKAKVSLTDPIPSNISFLTEGEVSKDILIHSGQKHLTEMAILESDLIICLDFNSLHRTDTLEKALLESKADRVLVDHHLAPDRSQFSLVFSETQISSASELLYHILLSLPPVNGDASALPAEAALALMTGMTTDTNNFMNSVDPSTLHMASSLLAAGVDRDFIIEKVYRTFREDRIRLQGHLLKDLMKITPDGVAYIVLDRNDIEKYKVEDGDTEGFVNIPLSIDKVQMSIFVKEDGERLRVSIRSKRGISANRCAGLHFNGGGHENAAGGRLNIPSDVADIADVAEYIETHTHTFMTEGK